MIFLYILSIAQSKFFILSDLHYDIEFSINSNSSNSCHSEYNTSNIYRKPFELFCDSSYSLIESTLKQMASVDPNPEFILLTGDLIAHKTMTMTLNGVLDSERNKQYLHSALQNLSDTMLYYFPNTQIIPVIGNNDGYNHYSMPKGYFKQEYLNFVYAVWGKQENISRTFLTDGYYSVKTVSGYTIICLNTLLFSYRHDADISGQIQMIWLKSQLDYNENIIISMHIPPGFTLYQGGSQSWHDSYIRTFNELIETYPEKIRAIYAGHFHIGYFELIADKFIIINPSISPFFGNNPGFRYYDLEEGDFFEYTLSSKEKEYEWCQSSFISRFGYEIDYFKVFKDLNEEIVEFDEFIQYSAGKWMIDGGYMDACRIIFGKLCSESKSYLLELALCGFRKLNSVDFLKCSNSI